MPGQSLWSITKNVANAVDTIETKIDSIDQEINIILTNNQSVHSKLDTIIHRSNILSDDILPDISSLDNSLLPHIHPDKNTTNNQPTIITSTPQTTLQVHFFNTGNGTTIVHINGIKSATKPAAQPTSDKEGRALLKIISGITLAATSMIYGTIGGSFATTLGFLDHEFGLLMVGPMLVVISLPLEYCGYKLVKSGLQDLKEVAKLRKKMRMLNQLKKTSI
jgi:hypothetical protein